MADYVRQRTPPTKRYIKVRKWGDGWILRLEIGAQCFCWPPFGAGFETLREAVWFRRQLAIALDSMIKENIAG
jgi:hypothetical protein